MAAVACCLCHCHCTPRSSFCVPTEFKNKFFADFRPSTTAVVYHSFLKTGQMITITTMCELSYSLKADHYFEANFKSSCNQVSCNTDPRLSVEAKGEQVSTWQHAHYCQPVTTSVVCQGYMPITYRAPWFSASLQKGGLMTSSSSSCKQSQSNNLPSFCFSSDSRAGSPAFHYSDLLRCATFRFVRSLNLFPPEFKSHLPTLSCLRTMTLRLLLTTTTTPHINFSGSQLFLFLDASCNLRFSCG